MEKFSRLRETLNKAQIIRPALMTLMLWTALLTFTAILPINAQQQTGAPLKLRLDGVRWLGNTTSLLVEANIGNDSKVVEVAVERDRIIEMEIEFKTSIPTEFSVKIRQGTETFLKLGGLLFSNEIRRVYGFYDENRIGLLNDDDALLTFEITGRFFSIELLLPIKGLFDVRGEINGLEVDVDVQPTSEGTNILIKNVLFTASNSSFAVTVTRNDTLLSRVEGSINAEGLTTISIKGGVIEKLKARAVITTGKHVGTIPIRVLRAMKIVEAGGIKKVIELTITSETAVYGKIPIRLLAYTKGWLLESPRLIEGATFEINIPRLGIMKVSRANETVYLIEGEDVRITVMADGYVSEFKDVKVTKDLQIITFYLRPSSPSIWVQIQEWATGVLRNQYFVPIALGVIITLIIIVLIRRK